MKKEKKVAIRVQKNRKNQGCRIGSGKGQRFTQTDEKEEGKVKWFLWVQFSHSVVSDSLWPNEPSMPGFPVHHQLPESTQTHVRWVWCHPTISSSVVPFSSCLQSFPASPSFQMSQLFASGGQNIGVSASTSVLPMNTQDWSPLGWTGWISLQSKGLSRVFSSTTVQKHKFFGAQLSL